MYMHCTCTEICGSNTIVFVYEHYSPPLDLKTGPPPHILTSFQTNSQANHTVSQSPGPTYDSPRSHPQSLRSNEVGHPFFLSLHFLSLLSCSSFSPKQTPVARATPFNNKGESSKSMNTHQAFIGLFLCHLTSSSRSHRSSLLSRV